MSQNVQNFKILGFGDYFGNHHEKCIRISTNMPGLESCGIWETKQFYVDGVTNGAKYYNDQGHSKSNANPD